MSGALYLAGPMGRTVGHDNRAAFDAAEGRLRAVGYEVHNPAAHPQPTDYDGVRICVMVVASEHTAGVALIDGWERSDGARTEAATAILLGKPARLVDDYANDRLRAIAKEAVAG